MLRKTVLAHALTIAFAAGVASVAVTNVAYAQSQTGAIVGNAAAGSTVTIVNKDIGYSRTVTAGSDGKFQLSQLPGGTYVLTNSGESQSVVVSAGENTSAVFAGGGVQKVVIAGRTTKIDVKSPESSLVLNKAAIDRVPVLRDVTSVALLAPGATAGDTRIGQTGSRGGNVPSLGGASPAENVYYINGFNVTNSLNGVAFNQVPFDAIAQQQVKTGGYGAEYGRSLGGVLAVTTKRGTNDWKGGANLIYTPESLASKQVYSEKSAQTGKWELHEKPGGVEDYKANLWLGGPIIKDKLFIFGLVQGAHTDQPSYFASSQQVLKNSDPQYLVKVDWQINQSNLLEFTGFSDKNEDVLNTWKSPKPFAKEKGEYKGEDRFTKGGSNLIGKYTSWVTDDLTLSAMYGVGKYERKSSVSTAACPFVQDQRPEIPLDRGCWTQPLVTPPGANDERKALRLDAEWNLGAHSLRFGLDYEKYSVVDGSSNTGVSGTDMGRYELRTLEPLSELSNGYVNNTGAAFDYMSVRTFTNGGVFTTKNSALYLEDTWQATKNLVAVLGLRSESFNNLNAKGVDFINVKHTIAPRLGMVWDVKGNAETKVFANAGRYYIPVMSNTNVRLAGAELDYTDYYAWNGTYANDRFETPTHGAQLGSRLEVSNGTAADPKTVVDPNIKPMYQDEFILGLQQAMGNRWSVTAKLTHRNLKSVMDDVCNDEGARAWAVAQNKYSAAEIKAIADTVGHCFLYNPGGALTANVDLAGDGKLTTISIGNEFLKFPKPKRTYNALELGFERAWDGKWSLQGSYVLAFSKGNTEGYVKSDIGQDDAGISQDWDYPGLAEGSTGYLPNDRRHTFKAFGAYQITPEFRLGANAVVQSGRPRNCLGFYSGNIDHVSIYYGPASFWCDRQLNNRGTLGRTEWKRDLSLQLQYAPKWKKGLSFTIDALNIFNERAVLSVREEGETAIGSPEPTYEQPLGLQPGRSFRLSAQYEF
jgi:outer membrane receptor for ferrienterochelin and colicin